MRSLASELAGLNLTEKDHDKIVESLKTIKNQMSKSVCRYCGEQISFVVGDARGIPVDPDGEPHWKTCASSIWFQKKASFNIMRKLAVFFTLKNGTSFEKEAGLSKKEIQVIHSVLDKEFRPRVEVKVSSDSHVIVSERVEDIKDVIDKVGSGHEGLVPGDIQFKPLPTDPIGDPDEAIAPPEDSITTDIINLMR